MTLRHALHTRAYQTPGGWWLYRIWVGHEYRWSEPLRRAEATDLLLDLGVTSNQATKRLRRARERYLEFVAAGRVVDVAVVPGAP